MVVVWPNWSAIAEGEPDLGEGVFGSSLAKSLVLVPARVSGNTVTKTTVDIARLKFRPAQCHHTHLPNGPPPWST